MPYLIAEWSKLRRSLILLLSLGAPVAVAGLTGLMVLNWERTVSWSQFATQNAAIWAFFMLPMVVTAISTLLAQLEHGPNSWKHLLALPISIWKLFAAKWFTLVILTLLMCLALVPLIGLSGTVANGLKGGAIEGVFVWQDSAWLLLRMFAAAIPLIAVQFFISLRYRSFVPGIAVGIGGTLVAVAATSSQYGIYFPWLMPTHTLASDPVRAGLALSYGLYGGLLISALAIWVLARQERS